MLYTIYLIGLLLQFIAVRSIFSFQVILIIFLMPAAFSANPIVLMIFSIGVLCIGLGAHITNLLKKFTPYRELKRKRKLPFKRGFTSSTSPLISIYIISLISVIGSAYYFSQVGISLFSDEVGLARLLNRHATSGSFFFQRLFRVFLPLACLVYFFYLQMLTRKKNLHKKSLLILTIVTSFFLVSTGLRGNILIFMMFPFVIAISMNFKSNKSTTKTLIYYILGALLAGVFITKLMHPEEPLLSIISLIITRLTGAATDGIDYAVYIDIPTQGYYYGLTYLNDILALFSKLKIIDGSYMNYSAYAAQQLLGEFYHGEAAAVYVFGEFYVNFGYYGVTIGSILLGIVLQLIYITSVRSPKTIMRSALWAYFSGVLITIMGGPTVSMTIDYILTCLFFIFAFIIISSSLKNKYKFNTAIKNENI